MVNSHREISGINFDWVEIRILLQAAATENIFSR